MVQKDEGRSAWEQHFHGKDYGDPILVVLKGHLLMEEEIDRILQAAFPCPERLPALRLHSKICVLQALDIPLQFGLEAALLLNALRNKLAHHLEHPQIDILVSAFISQVSPKIKHETWSEVREKQKLAVCISYLLGLLSGLRDFLEKAFRMKDRARSEINNLDKVP